MHPSVVALAQVLPPPLADREGRYAAQVPPPLPESGGDRFDWEEIEARTGWRYPADYKSFLETYGAGGTISRSISMIDIPPPVGIPYSVKQGIVWPPSAMLRRWGCDDVSDFFF